MIEKTRQKPPERVWRDFAEQESLTGEQVEKFKAYEAMLSEWNKSINLTAISGLSETVHRHFSDSIVLRQCLDMSNVKLFADVGSGAGFPGVPLKILFPDVGVILIEVSKKKQRFLRAVISELGFSGIEVCDLDWRTFLRKTESEVEYFLARASLDPAELSRMFKPGCSYKNAQLVYWAADDWAPDKRIEDFVIKDFSYTIKRKKRKLVFFGLKA